MGAPCNGIEGPVRLHWCFFHCNCCQAVACSSFAPGKWTKFYQCLMFFLASSIGNLFHSCCVKAFSALRATAEALHLDPYADVDVDVQTNDDFVRLAGTRCLRIVAPRESFNEF